jgi:predicted DCC family thiol-disulfide oxidoreductase YuxK
MSGTQVSQPLGRSSTELTVFFDGSCPLCRAEIGVYRDCPGAERVAFVDVAAAGAGDVAAGLSQQAAMARFHVLMPDGRLASGAAGFAALWMALPGWRWLGRIVSLPVIRSVAEAAYRTFLVVRPGMQWIWRKVRGNAER